MGTYVYDQAWRDERERLAGIERLWDDGTFALLERLGVGPGSHVAEVGAGGGSVVEWLAERVGGSGRVLAADVYLKFLEPLAGGPVEVAQRDILAEPLPLGEFDVVHTRLLVEHVGFGALANLVAGVKPGGLLVVEEYDFGCRGTAPRDADFDRVLEAVLDEMATFGFDRECGRKLPSELERLGLVDVAAEGRVRLIRSGTPDTAFSKLSLTTLRGRLVEAGRATDAEIDAILERADQPGTTTLSQVLVACWGTRAAGSRG
jgi:SAM-dependent methyltransferase